MAASPRIALLGFAIECNRFSPVTTQADFESDVDLRGDAIVAEARAPAPGMLPDLPGFVTEMDKTGPWTPVPLRVAQAQPGGPVDQTYFNGLLAELEAGLKAALPLDGVYVSGHGAGLATGSDDPDGDLYEMVRRVVGPDVPVMAVFDLHANVSARMVDNLSAFVGYRTNPHVDIRERGVEAARLMREALGGTRFVAAMTKIPLVPPTITLLTRSGPYSEIIAEGQKHVGGAIANVSAMAGFAYSDCPKNGFTVVVTARGDRAPAEKLAGDLARRTWDMRERFRKPMTSLDDAIAQAKAVMDDPKRPAILFADVADNPGGGGRGNTTYILRALHQAGIKGVILAVFNDAPLAAEAHKLGLGARFRARFNRDETDRFSEPFEADAEVIALTDGKIVGRRGLARGMSMDMGPSAALDLGGIVVVVISIRCQCLDPVQIESFGLDIGKARLVVVKSRGHFRDGFDEFFPAERIIEVDCPGLTSPALHNFAWTRLPRPVYPLDPHTNWAPA
jgi:microcystin degradation protein MlrC